ARVEEVHPALLGAGDDRVRRLVDLDEVGPSLDQPDALEVDQLRELPGELEPVLVNAVIVELDVDRERQRSGHGCLERARRLRLGVAELLDDPEPVLGAYALDGPVARRRVVPVDADLAEDADLLEAGHLPVEALHEVPALHLAVGDHVDAGPLLVADGDLNRVVEQLASVGRPVLALFDRVEPGPEPARDRVRADDAGRDEHFVLLLKEAIQERVRALAHRVGECVAAVLDDRLEVAFGKAARARARLAPTPSIGKIRSARPKQAKNARGATRASRSPMSPCWPRPGT